MKTKTLELLRKLQNRLSLRRRLVLLAVATLCLIPLTARADGIGDILSLFQNITHTLQGPIGGVLNEMQKVNAAINNFRQQIIWPLSLINQTRSFISATRARYTGLMSQIRGSRTTARLSRSPCSWNHFFEVRRPGRSHRFLQSTCRFINRYRKRARRSHCSAT